MYTDFWVYGLAEQENGEITLLLKEAIIYTIFTEKMVPCYHLVLQTPFYFQHLSWLSN